MSKTITERVPAGNMDCEKARAFPFLNCGGVFMRTGNIGGQPHDCGAIFKDVSLPVGVEVVSAELTCWYLSMTGFPFFHTILSGWNEARDDLVWNMAENMSNVPITTAHVHWDTPFDAPSNGWYHRHFDVKPIIDELMSLAGWRSHLDIGFPFRDNNSIFGCNVGLMTFEAFEGTACARLEITIKPRVILTTMSPYEVPVY